jgi:hypothetical protein
MDTTAAAARGFPQIIVPIVSMAEQSVRMKYLPKESHIHLCGIAEGLARAAAHSGCEARVEVA